MGNKATLQTNRFTSENQPPAHKKSRKGIPNRATVYKRYLKMRKEVPNPSDPFGAPLDIPLYEAAALAQILAAAEGNTRAWIEIQDTLHGKLTEKTEHSGAILHESRVILPQAETDTPTEEESRDDYASRESTDV